MVLEATQLQDIRDAVEEWIAEGVVNGQQPEEMLPEVYSRLRAEGAWDTAVEMAMRRWVLDLWTRRQRDGRVANFGRTAPELRQRAPEVLSSPASLTPWVEAATVAKAEVSEKMETAKAPIESGAVVVAAPRLDYRTLENSEARLEQMIAVRSGQWKPLGRMTRADCQTKSREYLASAMTQRRWMIFYGKLANSLGEGQVVGDCFTNDGLLRVYEEAGRE